MNNAISYRIREAEEQAKLDGVSPLEWAERKVKYWEEELDRRAMNRVADDDVRWTLADWREVVNYFKER